MRRTFSLVLCNACAAVAVLAAVGPAHSADAMPPRSITPPHYGAPSPARAAPSNAVAPLHGQLPERQLRDSRICEVWAARKSNATSGSGAGDVLTGMAWGYAIGWAVSGVTMTSLVDPGILAPTTGALVGAGVGATAGALQAMDKQIIRKRVYSECMASRGYEVYIQ